jgi:Secretion system C-terminal sorting domain
MTSVRYPFTVAISYVKIIGTKLYFLIFKYFLNKKISLLLIFMIAVAVNGYSQKWVKCSEPSLWGNVYGRPPCPSDTWYGHQAALIARYDDAGNRILVDFVNFGNKPSDESASILEKKLNEKISVNVFPNPTDEWLTITSDKIIEGSRLELYDVTGKIIISQSADYRNIMSLGDLQSGLYLLALQSSEGTLQWKIFKK